MKDKLTGWHIRGQMKLADLKERFLHEETGASHLVEIIVVIVIVIAVATIFQSQLTAAMTKIMEKLTTFVG